MNPKDVLPSTSTLTKHHRIHPINESNSSANDRQKPHTILNIPPNEDDNFSLQIRSNRTNSQTSVASASLDIRPGNVIKRITSPTGIISNTDEILPQTIFRRVSMNFNINNLVPTQTNVSSTSQPIIYDSNSMNINAKNHIQSLITPITDLDNGTKECEICYSTTLCECLFICKHWFCHSCLHIYIVDKIRNGCPSLLECPNYSCKQIIHPNDIKKILNDSQMYERYEAFMVKRLLQKMPDTRWCPYPNCSFAVLVENTHKATQYDCPACKRPFCQRCSQIWHPNLTCESAAVQRANLDPTLNMLLRSSTEGGNIRACPRCKSPIEKLDDGSCNHIRCAICTCEFCWLCMKEVDNMHFITPTGCTFYGKKRWSKSKSILFLTLAWLLTPLIFILFIVIGIPILLILIPILVTKKIYRYTLDTNISFCSRFLICTFIFLCTSIVSPLIIILILIIGIPLLIFFVYIYMPIRYVKSNW